MHAPAVYRSFGADADAEWAAILALTASEGHPTGFERRFEVERRERWYRHNPLAYSFYELDDQLLGYRCMLPIHPSTYWKLRRTDLAARDLHREDILTPEEADRSRRTGLAYIVAAWCEADDQIYRQMLADTFTILGACNLQGLYAETSGPHEEFCQAMGLMSLPGKGRCPWTGVSIQAWCADREYTRDTRTSLAAFFQQVDAAYGPADGKAPPMRLREREKAVAYLYFVKRRTREETAARLNISPNTVQDHVNAILRAAEPFLTAEPFLAPPPVESAGKPGIQSRVGSKRTLPRDSPRTQVGDLLERHPELLAPAEPAARTG